MRCLTPDQCSEWLRESGIIESPYSRDEDNDQFCLQFVPPEKASRLTAFMRWLYGGLGEFPGALVVFTDWSLYKSDEMALMNSLRRGHNEKRELIDAPGHLFQRTDADDAIGICYLAVIFGWSAYLYLGSGAVTILFWEGDLIDVWTSDDALAKKIRGIVKEFELRITGGTHA